MEIATTYGKRDYRNDYHENLISLIGGLTNALEILNDYEFYDLYKRAETRTLAFQLRQHRITQFLRRKPIYYEKTCAYYYDYENYGDYINETIRKRREHKKRIEKIKRKQRENRKLLRLI
jgi:hypothetical protein